MSNWNCWYVKSVNDNVVVTIGTTTYNDTAINLANNYPSLFRGGTSQDGNSIALCADLPTGTPIPLSATVNGTSQLSTQCELDIWGNPRPPNK